MKRYLILAVSLFVGGCAIAPPAQTIVTPPGAISTLSDADLREVLADFANAHQDKIELAFWVSTPLRSIDPQFKSFFDRMGRENKALNAELTGWAKSHNVNLGYSYGKDFYSQAQKLMEFRQEKEI